MARRHAIGPILSSPTPGKIKRTLQISTAPITAFITDAIEGCFCFNIEEKDYDRDTKLSTDEVFADGLKKAIAIETKIADYYSKGG